MPPSTYDVDGDPHALHAGDTVGRFVLERQLGEGGMGAVWIAADPLLEAPVALKVLHPFALGAVGVQRLLREARTAAGLKHPAIVRVIDFGIGAFGQPFLALELLEGETLAEFGARGVVAPEAAVALLLPVLDALSVAHDHGIVHRDIKPENLFVSRDGRGRLQPKILDFGIAISAAPGSARLTQQGSMVGSPAYMAPEQARGESDVDGRADVWAVGVTLHELMTGTLPFERATVPHMLTAILEADAPSLAGVTGMDETLAAIVSRAMKKRRADRFRTAREMGEALAAWLIARDVHEDACGTSLRSAWLGEAPVRGSMISIGAARRGVDPNLATLDADVARPVRVAIFEAASSPTLDSRSSNAPSTSSIPPRDAPHRRRWLFALPALAAAAVVALAGGLSSAGPEAPRVLAAAAGVPSSSLPDDPPAVAIAEPPIALPSATVVADTPPPPPPRPSTAGHRTRVPLGRRPWF